MKRALVAVAVVLALTIGTFTVEAATHQESKASADTISCVIGISGFGVTIIGSFYTAGTPVWLSFLGISSGFAGFGEVAMNHDCAADSYYHHIGHRELCYNAYFIGWADNGDAMFRPGVQGCLTGPVLNDHIFCDYIHPVSAYQECVQQNLWYVLHPGIYYW